MAWSSSPTTQTFRRSPQSSRSSRYWAGLVSWNSSTSTWRKRLAQRAAQLGVGLEQLRRAQQEVAEVHRAGPGQRLLVAAPDLEAALGLHVVLLEADRGRASGPGSSSDRCGRARRAGRSGRRRRCPCRRGSASPAASGRRRRRWRRTAAARPAPPRAAGSAPRRRGRSGPRRRPPPGPSRSASRSRISPAALLVKVTASTCQGATPRSRTRWAMRWTMTRVLPEPAPASTSSGPSPCSTASRWASFRGSRMGSRAHGRTGRAHRGRPLRGRVD